MKFRNQITINKPIGTVYKKYIENFGSEFLFNSALSESKIPKANSLKDHKKICRSLTFKDSKFHLTEEITKQSRNSAIEISLVDTNMPIKSYKKKFIFSALDKNVTEVSYVLNYDMKFSILSLLRGSTSMEKVLCHENFVKEFKSYVEDGTIFNDAIIYN